MSQIPQEIKDKIEANKPDVNLLAHKAAWELMFANKLTISRRDEYRNGYYEGWHVGAEFGYSLALAEIEELKAKVQFAANKLYEANSEIHELKAEIERLKKANTNLDKENKLLHNI